MSGNVIEQTLIVLLVLIGLVMLLWLLRRKGIAQIRVPGRKRSGPRQLEVVERLPLTATHSLHLVRAGEMVLLVGVSPSSCQTLAAMPPASASRKPEVLSWDAS